MEEGEEEEEEEQRLEPECHLEYHPEPPHLWTEGGEEEGERKATQQRR